jgi:ribosomal protein S18 acetylase RimI-like enzyme
MKNAGIDMSPPFSPAADRRPVVDDDREYLFELFCSTLAPENPLLMLPLAERETLLRMQFDAREEQYRATYTLADFDLLLLNGMPVGNLYADRGDKEYVLIDIALLPEFRRRGIGTTVVRNLLDEAGALFLPVRAHVQKHNPAWGLWQRLGFELIGDEGVFYHILAPALRS